MIAKTADPCPWCGEMQSEVSSVKPGKENRAPKPRDISLCLNCGEWSVFKKDLTRRKPTKREEGMIKRTEAAQVAEQAWLTVVAKDRTSH